MYIHTNSKSNALDINDKKSPDTDWRNENISKYGNISFTRSYSYISLHVHLNNYKSINLLKGGSTKQHLISVMITTGKVYFINAFKEVLHNP